MSDPTSSSPRDALELADYRRRVAAVYAQVRTFDDPHAAWQLWTRERNRLFATHPQSPVIDDPSFEAVLYFDYDPTWRFEVEVGSVDQRSLSIEHSTTGSSPYETVGTVTLEHGAASTTLSLYWLSTYGGGLFLPFRDATNGTDAPGTYGGGRYLLDTVKGADLGVVGDRLVLDFNFSFHPSCAHSPRWSCPLAPPGNSFATRVEAGERLT